MLRHSASCKCEVLHARIFLHATDIRLPHGSLYLGKQFGPEPSVSLCIFQAATIYGTAVLYVFIIYTSRLRPYIYYCRQILHCRSLLRPQCEQPY